MSNTDPIPQSEVIQRNLRQVATFERPPEERPSHDSLEAIVEWLLGPARRQARGLAVFDEFAWRMLAAGLPLLRLTFHARTLHPQFLGTTFTWWRTTGQTVQVLIGHEILDSVADADNPVRRVSVGGETLRRRLGGPDAQLDFSVLHDLKAVGATDYLALPVDSHYGGHYMVTYVTDRVTGFSEQEIVDLTQISQRLSVVFDMYSQRALVNNLLTAYLGAKTGPKVLNGQIRRGTGEEITAVLWSSDLRGFTARSDRLPERRTIAILNALFDAQAQVIHDHGGEILKFIGDGLLAIFAIDDTVPARQATRAALEAATQALEAMRRLGEDPTMAEEPPLEIVVALHVGTVMYGNIGAANRLDFTVIGPAVNLTSRVEAIAKAINVPIIVTDAFAMAFDGPLVSLGHHRLRGLSAPHELFGVPGYAEVGRTPGHDAPAANPLAEASE
ncbi:MAG TPA: adenylate/guanylate cyclase domain-containing protein [Xanthobacteraceae bacterium]|nr:adenylate/guanylate cyclase domain-containing protein [Xanthobacteraceae bacterium]